MSNFYEIKPVFHISDENIKMINRIEKKLLMVQVPDDTKRKNLKIKSKVRSIYSSLAIEANSLSLNSVSNIIDNKLVLGNRKEIQEVKNANELYENIGEYNYLSEQDFLKAYVIMMKFFDDDNGGYRNHGEGVKKGDKIIFMAPDSLLVPSLMKGLFKFVNDNKDKLHPIILSSIFHYYFVFIHPFTDGNGRMARFWVSLMLTNYNSKFEYIPIEEEIYLNQKEYYDSISSCHTNGNANEFISFMLETIESVINKTTQETTQKVKLNDNQQKIVDLINDNPSITRNELADKLDITSDGVKYNLSKLTKNNVIERIGPDNGGYWKVNI
ncbi:MAG: Fic family protein [Bacilli bacterium]|nr:Fic family protein [Bacilli bacterium]